MEAVVERLARSPRLGLIDRELSDLWKRERTARERFYDSIEDGQKVEFINKVYLLNALGRYGLIQKASGFDDLRSGVLTGFKVPVAAVFDDRTNLAALKKLLK